MLENYRIGTINWAPRPELLPERELPQTKNMLAAQVAGCGLAGITQYKHKEDKRR